MPGLLGAEDVAGAADLQVTKGDLEPGPQFGELFDGFQSARRFRRHRPVGGKQQVRIRPVLVPADAAPELVQVGEAIAVGVVDEDCVRVRDVEPALDDGRRHEQVRLPLHERDHRLLEFVRRLLAVRDDDFRLRHDRPDFRRDGVDVLHAVVDEIDLPLAVEFAQDRLADERPVETRDPRLDRQPFRRRRLQVRDVANPEQSQMQRPRDRRRGQRQHVHHRPQAFQPFLVLDAEPLFLVDDDQAQVFEPHVFRDEPVRADDDVHPAGDDPLQGPLLLRRRLEAAQSLNDERVFGQPRGERAQVLLGENRGRNQHRNLLTVVDALESCADGEFGLAIADVTAKEAVHRPGPLHVRLDLPQAGHLIGRLAIRERRLELALPVRVGRERESRLGGANGLQLQHLGGHVVDRGLDALLPPGPAGAAEFRQLRFRLGATDVLLHQVDLRRRHIDVHPAAEFQQQVLFFGRILCRRPSSDS